MDWDWDLGACLKRLFKVQKKTRVGPSRGAQIPTASGPRIDVNAGSGGTLKISMGEMHGSLPKEVQIAYKTKTGETQHLTFTPVCPIPGNNPISERSCDFEPSAEHILGSTMWRNSAYRNWPSAGEQEIDDMGIGASSLDTSHFKDSEDTSVEDPGNGYEGKEVEFDEVRVGGDVISICSLD